MKISRFSEKWLLNSDSLHSQKKTELFPKIIPSSPPPEFSHFQNWNRVFSFLILQSGLIFLHLPTQAGQPIKIFNFYKILVTTKIESEYQNLRSAVRMQRQALERRYFSAFYSQNAFLIQNAVFGTIVP